MQPVDGMTGRDVLGRVSIALCTVSPDVAVVTWNVGIADNTDDGPSLHKSNSIDKCGKG